MDNQSFFKLKELISEKTGIVYYQDKESDLSIKIKKRMHSNGVYDYDKYWNLITNGEEGEKEFHQLVNTLTIGETYFFRDKAVFQGIREMIIPQVIEKNRSIRSLRIWCAGCASGEEVYSLSIILKHEFSVFLSGWKVMILGTDINQNLIAQAIDGRYRDWSFRETPEEIKNSCFKPMGKYLQLKKRYKASTHFEYHNMVKDPFPSLVHNLVAFDIILNRNVIIYFNEETSAKLIPQFEETLVDGGWLIMGHSDHNIKYFSNFKTIRIPGAFFYKKVKKGRFEESDKKEYVKNSIKVTKSAIIPNRVTQKKEKKKAIPPSMLRKDLKKIEISQSEIKRLSFMANRGEWDQAMVLTRELLKKDKFNPTVYFFQALLEEQTGQMKKAENLLKKTLFLDRKFVLGHYHLGLLMQKKRI